jgi:hypothetical protein
MSVNSAVLDLHMAAQRTEVERGNELVTALRGLVGRSRSRQGGSYLNVGDSYVITGGRRTHERGPSWIHTHH